jgi:DNA-binding GntR family transcriptional regulator
MVLRMSSASLQPVVKRSAESLALDALRSHVLSGAAAPGQRLTEINLAERLRVSRATLRTALHQLTREGLIHQIPYTGWEVASLTGHDAWEIYTLRSSLEGLAARLAAERRPDVKRSIGEAFAALKRACRMRDHAAISDADFALHRTIIGIARHGRLLKQYELIESQTRLYIHWSNALIVDPKEILAQHSPIVEAILAGRSARAARLSEQHNFDEGEKLVAFLNSRGRP